MTHGPNWLGPGFLEYRSNVLSHWSDWLYTTRRARDREWLLMRQEGHTLTARAFILLVSHSGVRANKSRTILSTRAACFWPKLWISSETIYALSLSSRRSSDLLAHSERSFIWRSWASSTCSTTTTVLECGSSVMQAMCLLTRGGVAACVGVGVGVGVRVGTGVVVLEGVDGLGSARVGVCSGRGRW